MPAQRTRNPSSGPKRTNDHHSHPPIRELEFTMSSKRQLSCAECRRLKRRCDRQWPCKSCISRGCASICPDGTLTQGVGGRFVLSGSEDLHRKIQEMGDRIRDLEEALSSAWSPRNGDVGEHPLLRKDLLRIKLPPDVQSAELSSTSKSMDSRGKSSEMGPVEQNADGLSDGLGTLAIVENEGKMTYMGRTAKLEYILQGDEEIPTQLPPSEYREPRLPYDILSIAESFFLSVPADTTVDFHTLLNFLPDRERGIQLVNLYYDNCAFFYQPMERHFFFSRVFDPIYSLPLEDRTPDSTVLVLPKPIDPLPFSELEDLEIDTVKFGPPDLALLFMILSGGANVDKTLKANNEEVQDYHDLAKVAMSLARPWNSSTFHLSQTIHLMIYNSLIWEQSFPGLEYIWALMGLLSSMTMTLGLHRDAYHWGVSPGRLQKRRRIFWDTNSLELWQTLGFGRPPFFFGKYIDVKQPITPEIRDTAGNLLTQSFAGQLFRFINECLQPIIDYTFSVRDPDPNPIATVAELDKKLDNFKIVDMFRMPHEPPTLAYRVQSRLIVCAVHYARMYAHRAHFAHAIAVNPDSPLDTPYGESVMCTIRAANSLFTEARGIYEVDREVMGRFGLLWTYALKIGVPMTVICERSPRGPLANHAIEQLRSVLEFVKTAQDHHPGMQRMVTLLNNMHIKAVNSLNSITSGPTSLITPNAHKSVSPETQDTEESSAYSGQFRVVHLPERRGSPPRSRSRHTTDSPKDKNDMALYMHGQESTRQVTSSMRGLPAPPAGSTTYPTTAAAGSSYMIQEATTQVQGSHSHNQQAYPTYYNDPNTGYSGYPSQQEQQQQYQPSNSNPYSSYVVDSSGGSSSGGDSVVTHTSSYNTNPNPNPNPVNPTTAMYSVEYNNSAAAAAAANGMMNAAMRDYDLAWLSHYRPQR